MINKQKKLTQSREIQQSLHIWIENESRLKNMTLQTACMEARIKPLEIYKLTSKKALTLRMDCISKLESFFNSPFLGISHEDITPDIIDFHNVLIRVNNKELISLISPFFDTGALLADKLNISDSTLSKFKNRFAISSPFIAFSYAVFYFLIPLYSARESRLMTAVDNINLRSTVLPEELNIELPQIKKTKVTEKYKPNSIIIPERQTPKSNKIDFPLDKLLPHFNIGKKELIAFSGDTTTFDFGLLDSFGDPACVIINRSISSFTNKEIDYKITLAFAYGVKAVVVIEDSVFTTYFINKAGELDKSPLLFSYDELFN